MPTSPPKPKGLEAPWQTIALTSGIFAALNAILAKLTTATFTSTLSSHISPYMPLPEKHLTLLLRALVFLLSFSTTGIMWSLYTKALSVAPSAVSVNIVNTGSNFIVTAVLGAVVFGEKLPVLWWVGAGCLVAGCVVIARAKEEKGRGKVE